MREKEVETAVEGVIWRYKRMNNSEIKGLIKSKSRS
jgi:hypothetical protein